MQQTECGPTDPATPASIAGLLPGDTIVGFDGVAVTSWDQLTDLIRGSAGQTVQIDYVREVTGSDASWVPVPEADLLAAGVQPWVHLPLWLPADIAPTAWDVGTRRARELGLPSRPVRESVADTWAWMATHERPAPPIGRELPGLPPELEAGLLTTH